VIIYLQGIALTPMNASLLLVPGYVGGIFPGHTMGRLSDNYGSRGIAALGIFFSGLAIVVYITLSPIFITLYCAFSLPCYG